MILRAEGQITILGEEALWVDPSTSRIDTQRLIPLGSRKTVDKKKNTIFEQLRRNGIPSVQLMQGENQ